MMRLLVLNDDIALVSGKDGIFLVNRHDIYVGKSLELYGEYSAIESQLLASLLCPDDNVIEVGANIGSQTIGLAKRVGPQGKVFAFEPQRACFALLQAQIALNQLNNIYAFCEGIGAENETFWLPSVDYQQSGNFGRVSLEAENKENHEAVAVRKIDTFFLDTSIDLIKIDVEGMEREVLIGAQALINKCRPILYLENDRLEKSKELIAFILGLGYRLWWHLPPLYNPENYFGVKENVYITKINDNTLANIISFNMVGIHSSKYIPLPGLTEIKSADELHPLEHGYV